MRLFILLTLGLFISSGMFAQRNQTNSYKEKHLQKREKISKIENSIIESGQDTKAIELINAYNLQKDSLLEHKQLIVSSLDLKGVERKNLAIRNALVNDRTYTRLKNKEIESRTDKENYLTRNYPEYRSIKIK